MADPGRGSAGFQAALESYLARGGPLRNDSTRGKAGTRYTEGPLRGLTEAQAVARARRLWMRASPQVRANYERMEQATMSPSPAPAEVRPPLEAKATERNALTENPVSHSTQKTSPPLRRSLVEEMTTRTRAAWENTLDFAGKIFKQDAGNEQTPFSPRSPHTSGERRINPLTDKPFGWVPAEDGSDARSAEEQAGPVSKRINPLTGKPFGWIPAAGRGIPIMRPVHRGRKDARGTDLEGAWGSRKTY